VQGVITQKTNFNAHSWLVLCSFIYSNWAETIFNPY
jgi:hypothetical protein